MIENNLELSCLPHTWLIDIDGTVFLHNGHLSGTDEILPGVKEFWNNLPDEDTIILLSARTTKEAEQTIKALNLYELRFDQILFEIPHGERIVINDKKPSGLNTAYALNIERNFGLSKLSMSIHKDW